MNHNFDMLDYLFDLRGYVILENAVEQDLLDRLNQAIDPYLDMQFEEWRGYVQRFDNNGNAGIELQNIVEGGKPFEELIDHPAWVDRLLRYCGEKDSYVEGLFIDECFASIRRQGGFFPVHSGNHEGNVRNQFRFVNNQFRCGQVNILLALDRCWPGGRRHDGDPWQSQIQFCPPRYAQTVGGADEDGRHGWRGGSESQKGRCIDVCGWTVARRIYPHQPRRAPGGDLPVRPKLGQYTLRLPLFQRAARPPDASPPQDSRTCHTARACKTRGFVVQPAAAGGSHYSQAASSRAGLLTGAG
jgi:hypothetical protein